MFFGFYLGLSERYSVMLRASWLIILCHGGMFSGFYLGLSERYSVMLRASWLIILNHGGMFSGFYLGLRGRYSDTPGILANNFKSWRDVFWVLPGTKRKI